MSNHTNGVADAALEKTIAHPDGTTTSVLISEAEIKAHMQEVNRKRGEACFNAIQEVLRHHKCRVRIEVQIAGEFVPLDAVLAFPAKIGILTE